MASFSNQQDTVDPHLAEYLDVLFTFVFSVVMFIGVCELNHVRTPIIHYAGTIPLAGAPGL